MGLTVFRSNSTKYCYIRDCFFFSLLASLLNGVTAEIRIVSAKRLLLEELSISLSDVTEM